jgi:hypothetical protein
MREMTEIDDDHFEYDAGMRQCISGFGRNATLRIREVINDALVGGFDDPNEGERVQHAIDWHINELVRWCRHFNAECQRLKQEVTGQ